MPQWGGAAEKCKVCKKTVYEMEKLQVGSDVFHKTCFKCVKCGKILRAGDFTAIKGETFCKPHYKQLFRVKGNYEEGFNQALADAQKAQQQQDTKKPTKDMEEYATEEPEPEPEPEPVAEGDE